MLVEDHETGIDHRPRSHGVCGRLRPDFGIKKLGGCFVLYEGDYFNLILGPDYFGKKIWFWLYDKIITLTVVNVT